VAGLWFTITSSWRAFARLPRRGRLGLRGLGGSVVRARAVIGAIQTQRGKLVPEWNVRLILPEDFCLV
jgi:hypothetical protein